MSGKKICIEVDGVFYNSLVCAKKELKYDRDTIKRRCLSDKFPNYKFVPFRITYTEKKCTVCGDVKLLNKFYASNDNRDGFASQCKQCVSNYGKECYKNDPDKFKERVSDWQENNPEYNELYRLINIDIIRARDRERYKKDPEKAKELTKKWKENNLEYCKEYDKKWREDNPNYQKEYDKKWKEDNPDYQKEWQKENWDNNPSYKLSKNIGNAIRLSLKGNKNGRHWETLVGWTVKEGRDHLESLFTEGMSWENHGNGKFEWNLDHIVPIKEWNITPTDYQALKDCWALDNLQPSWAIRNKEKGSKPMHPKYLIKPF